MSNIKVSNFSVEFTLEFRESPDNDILVIHYPMDLWIEATKKIESIKNYVPVKWSEKYLSEAIDMYVFMMVFDWVREFPMKSIISIVGTSTTGYTWATKILEASNLVRIDKSLTNKNDKKPYSWYVNRIDNVSYDYNDMTSSEYDITGTAFAGAIRVYEKSLECDVFKPERINASFISDDCNAYPVPEYLPYRSDYGLLSYRYSSEGLKDRIQEAWIVETLVSKLGCKTIYKSGRIYNAFHYIPKKYRYNLEYNGSPLTELFDLHCSFYTLSVGMIFDMYPDVKYEDLEKFYDRCSSGKLYDDLADEIGCTRGEAKEKLQGWRNCWRYGALNFEQFGYSKVTDFMRKNYPVIATIYENWPKRKNADGHIIKALQLDSCIFETNIMSNLASVIYNKYGVTLFLLHDAIYISEKEKSLLPSDIDKEIAEWFRNNLLLKHKK